MTRMAARRGGRLRLKAPVLGELRHVAPSLTAEDPCFVAEWRAGTFAAGGHAVTLLGRSPLACHDVPAPWLRALHGFGWLRHVPFELEDDDSAGARTMTRTLVRDWLGQGAHRAPVAAEGAVMARRVMSFLAHSDLLLEDADQAFYDAIARQIASDLHGLASAWNGYDDRTRLMALAAELQANLCFSDGARTRPGIERALKRELDRQIFGDGGHVSRSADLLVALLIDLVPVKQLYAAEHLDMPAAIDNTIGRMIDCASRLRLGDGQLTRLGGGGTSDTSDVAPFGAITRFATTGCWDAPESRFARLDAAGTVVIVDTGSAARSGAALAFEMSDSVYGVVTSAGANTGSQSQGAARHSTLLFENPPPLEPGQWLPALEVPAHAALTNPSGGAVTLDATQSDYAALGLAHRRLLTLSADGRVLDGEDTLRPMAGVARGSGTAFAIYFQLDPHVVVRPGKDASTVELSAGPGHVWQFTANQRLSLEPCLIAGRRPRQSLQLVVRCQWPDVRAVTWRFARRDDAVAATAG